ncbi:MAG: hypothetical protein LBS69_01020 [Prevotellaceae bacterium]|jgi:hypothetical protein|nr:hypothetical protein [Prevotellaceae bacterium]
MKKVKFNDLTGNKEVLKAEELAVLTGGQRAELLASACESNVCQNNRPVGIELCSNGSGSCVSGVGVCTENT